MGETLRITRVAAVENLRDLLHFVSGACADAGSPPSDCHALKLAVEEVCMNVMTHGYRGREPGPITLTFHARPDEIVVTVADAASPFRPGDAPIPDTDGDWRDRPIGGLGWHLVRNLVDDVRHDSPAGGGNRVTLVKKRAAG